MPRKSDTLTGGTRDVNPQQWKLQVTIPSGVYSTVSGVQVANITVQTPISRLPKQGGKVTIMEIVKIRWNTAVVYVLQATTSAITPSPWVLFTTGILMTSPIVSPGPLTPQVIDSFQEEFYYSEATPGNTPLDQTNTPLVSSGPTEAPSTHEMHDGAGHGILVASDNLTLQINAQIVDQTVSTDTFFAGVPQFTDASVVCEIFYRFKDVTLTEYIGIVQSQQAS